MAGSLSEIASQILQATTTPGGHSSLPRFLIRPLAVLATTDSSGREGKGVSDALVREAIALFDASRKRGPTADRVAATRAARPAPPPSAPRPVRSQRRVKPQRRSRLL